MVRNEHHEALYIRDDRPKEYPGYLVMIAVEDSTDAYVESIGSGVLFTLCSYPAH